ncbi:MAG TPA: hypothetical protein VNX68_04005 [Nitrosopumilaceae archaeon]|jgi:hypothetical protein|nr:hypothetical protein [Nitrosopumilaceae archaeon]
MSDKSITLKLLAIVKKQQAMIERLANWSGPISPASVLQANTPNSAGGMAGAPGEVQSQLNKILEQFRVSIASIEHWETNMPKINLQMSGDDYPKSPRDVATLQARLKPLIMRVLEQHGKSSMVLSILPV